MDHEDLEKTTTINTLDDLSNQIKELAENPDLADEVKNKENNNKKKNKKENVFKRLKKWWSKQPKKKKILIISGIIILLIAIAISVFFLIKNLEKDEVVKEKDKDVIVQLDNYRYENGTLVFLNEDEEEIGTYKCENKDEQLCFISNYSNEDVFDVTKNVYEDGSFVIERIPIIDDTFVFINDNENVEDEIIKLYNIKEEKVTDTYLLVKKADKTANSFIAKNSEDSYGILSFDESGVKEELSFTYDYLGYVNGVEDFGGVPQPRHQLKY